MCFSGSRVWWYWSYEISGRAPHATEPLRDAGNVKPFQLKAWRTTSQGLVGETEIRRWSHTWDEKPKPIRAVDLTHCFGAVRLIPAIYSDRKFCDDLSLYLETKMLNRLKSLLVIWVFHSFSRKIIAFLSTLMSEMFTCVIQCFLVLLLILIKMHATDAKTRTWSEFFMTDKI